MEKTYCHLLQWSIFPLSHTIMWWCVWNWLFHSNLLWFTIMVEISFNVLSSFIISYVIDIFPETILNHSFKSFKKFKNLWFLFHEIYPAEPWTIINKCKEIPRTINLCCRNWTSKITMYHIKCRGNSIFLPNFISLLWMFT